LPLSPDGSAVVVTFPEDGMAALLIAQGLIVLLLGALSLLVLLR